MSKAEYPNAWVFLSHSNKDFKKLVPVRNKLEKLGYRPLLFYLKCLDDHKEIIELIKREIDARERFILCQSRNSDESPWVQEEMDYIRSTGRPYEVINLDASKLVIDSCIEHFDQRSTAYVVSTEDAVTGEVTRLMADKAFKVDPIQTGRVFYEKDSVLKGAYLLVLVSRRLSKEEVSQLNQFVQYFEMNAVAYRFYDARKTSKEVAHQTNIIEFRVDDYAGNNSFFDCGEDDFFFRDKRIGRTTESNVAEEIVKDLLKWDSERFNGEYKDLCDRIENREPIMRRKVGTNRLLAWLRDNLGSWEGSVPMVLITRALHQAWLREFDLSERAQTQYLNILDTPRFMALINHHARRKGLSYPNIYVCDDLEILFWALEDLVNIVSEEAHRIIEHDKHRSTISAFGYLIQHLLEANGVIF